MGIEDWYSNLGAYQNHPEDKKTQITRLHTLISQDGRDLFLYMGEVMGIRDGVRRAAFEKCCHHACLSTIFQPLMFFGSLLLKPSTTFAK